MKGQIWMVTALAVVLIILGMPSFAAPLVQAASPVAGSSADPLVARGRYIVETGGCNDCHTPGYAQQDGKVPESEWLTGDVLGWRGPWGTTYPTNLRLRLQHFTEAQWMAYARNLRARPPMPWFNVVAMTDEDLRALYRYTRAMGPAGQPAPEYVPPDREPKPPYVQFPMPPGVQAGLNHKTGH